MEMTFVFIISIFMCIFIHFLSVYGLTVGSYCILFIPRNTIKNIYPEGTCFHMKLNHISFNFDVNNQIMSFYY